MSVQFTPEKGLESRTLALSPRSPWANDPRSIRDGEWLLFQFFLRTGFRLQEVQHVELRDVDFVDGVVALKEKKDWKPKDTEEREVPVPEFLLAALKNRPSGRLFPQKDPLQTLLNLVKRAGLPGTWRLHKFRKSYAAIQHQDGVSARTIQQRLGHSHLETTLAYLEAEEPRSQSSRDQVNPAFAAFDSAPTTAVQ